MFHLRALNEIERQRWVTALELAKNQAIKKLEGGNERNQSVDWTYATTCIHVRVYSVCTWHVCSNLTRALMCTCTCMLNMHNNYMYSILYSWSLILCQSSFISVSLKTNGRNFCWNKMMLEFWLLYYSHHQSMHNRTKLGRQRLPLFYIIHVRTMYNMYMYYFTV